MRKKFLQGAAALSMAAAACIMGGLITASAETLPKDKVTVDYENQKIIVEVGTGTPITPPTGSEGTGDGGVTETQTGDDGSGDADGDEGTVIPPATPAAGDRQIKFNVASVNKNKVLKATAWEVYDVKDGTDGKVTIDISSLNTQKDNYVQIKGDVSEDPLTLLIPATDKSLKLKFNAYTGLAEFNKGADASKTADYEYRTQYSDWSEAAKLDNTSLKMYQERGSQLYFRLASAKASETASAGTAVTDVKVKVNKTDAALNDVYKMSALPGKEIKVKVGKKANAPKASVSYTKGTVTIPNGTMYRINTAEGLGEFGAATSAKVTLSSASTGDAKTAYDALVAGGSLEVKKAGDATKKKAESKIFLLEFPNPKATLTVTGEGEDVSKNDVTKNSIGDPADETKKVTVTSIAEVKKGNVVQSLTMTVDNKTDFNYEVVVGEKPTADKKGTVVKSGKTANIKKISKDGAAVWIRRCADQKKAEWTTEYVQMGMVPAASTTTPDTPGTDETKVTEADLQAFAAEYIANPVLLATSGVAQGDPVDIGASGKGFTWASKDYKVTVNDTEKTLKGVTVAVKSVTNNALLPALDETNTSDGIKYGTGCANIGLMTADNAPSAIVTITCGDVSYEHTLTFSKQS